MVDAIEGREQAARVSWCSINAQTGITFLHPKGPSTEEERKRRVAVSPSGPSQLSGGEHGLGYDDM